MEKRMVMFVGLTLLGASALVGCNVHGSEVSPEDEHIPKRLDEILVSSSTIVKARFTERIAEENMIRSSANPSEPSEEFYSEGHIYQFQVEKCYKGSDEETVTVVTPYAKEVSIQGTFRDRMVEHVDYEPIDESKTYILFLNELAEIEQGLYGPASAAFIVEVCEAENVRFYSKRIEGQLAENVIVEEGNEEFKGKYVTEVTGFLMGDYIEDVLLLNDLLAAEGIETLRELEAFLNQ
ncbi:hypothetical protein JCM19046_4344 [Bacillus sp. JCM 19046]|nr:hypothetical protein JCM19045_4910 [Bacillus sp. JCM 19045]GAF19676.1 hypothetical protein JCM19046_4344 [Bacillus sp. JCM 19046]